MGEKVFLAHCTLPEVEAHLRASPKIVVPVGATEQHGPHAPFGTDAILSTEASVRLARRIGALVAPALAYGLSGEHRGYAGVPFVSASTMTALVQDVVVSLAGGGFREIILVNGHYTNSIVLHAAIFEPAVSEIALQSPPVSHNGGPQLLNVLKVMDVPQAAAMAAGKCKVRIISSDTEPWKYPHEVANKMGYNFEVTAQK